MGKAAFRGTRALSRPASHAVSARPYLSGSFRVLHLPVIGITASRIGEPAHCHACSPRLSHDQGHGAAPTPHGPAAGAGPAGEPLARRTGGHRHDLTNPATQHQPPNDQPLRKESHMKRLSRLGHRAKLLTALTAALVLGVVATAAAGALPLHQSGTPDGYNKFLVYMANGVYDPHDPTYTAPSGTFFQKEIMHRSDAEIAEQLAQAKAFFKERFGIDEANGDVSVGLSMFDPRNNYRAYVIGGEKVPDSGWVVRDGGINAVATKDTFFHGTYGGPAGKFVKAGTAVTFGDYNILRTQGESAQPAEPLILHYQSDLPIKPADSDGVRTFRCELIDPLTGHHGIAQGVIAPMRDAGNGQIQVSIRNTLTFPGY